MVSRADAVEVRYIRHPARKNTDRSLALIFLDQSNHAADIACFAPLLWNVTS